MFAATILLHCLTALSIVHESHARSISLSHSSKASRVLRRQDDDEFDPADQTWVKNWAAIGDSFAAGIGAGERLGGLGDWWCSRTDESYPNQMKVDARMNPDAKFTFWACSGAEIHHVVDDQLPQLPKNQDLVTLTAGGNDLEFVELLNQCIFRWNADLTNALCQTTLDKAAEKLDSEDFAKSLDNLLSKTKEKLTPDGRIYYTGYGKFFAEDDEQCDKVSWSYWHGVPYAYLTLERRKSFNELVDELNKKISEAVDRAGDQVVFVDWGQYVGNTIGRFCEKGFPEPDDNRLGLRYYEYNTDDDKDGDNLEPRQDSQQSGFMEGTFEYTISKLVKDFMESNGTQGNLTSRYTLLEAQAEAQAPDPSDPKYQATDDQKDKATILGVLPDSYYRVFHPRPDGYSLIANLIFYSMSVERAKTEDFELPPEVGHSDTCPAPSETTDAPAETTEVSTEPSETENLCEGNQVQGDCVAGTMPSATPFSGPLGPQCMRPSEESPRLNEDKVLQTVQEWCQMAIDDGLVLSKGGATPKAGTQEDVAENGGGMSITVMYYEDGCPVDKSFDSYDFGKMGIDRCQENMGETITRVCVQDSTMTDYNKDYTVLGGSFGMDCVLWSIGGMA